MQRHTQRVPRGDAIPAGGSPNSASRAGPKPVFTPGKLRLLPPAAHTPDGRPTQSPSRRKLWAVEKAERGVTSFSTAVPHFTMFQGGSNYDLSADAEQTASCLPDACSNRDDAGGAAAAEDIGEALKLWPVRDVEAEIAAAVAAAVDAERAANQPLLDSLAQQYSASQSALDRAAGQVKALSLALGWVRSQLRGYALAAAMEAGSSSENSDSMRRCLRKWRSEATANRPTASIFGNAVVAEVDAGESPAAMAASGSSEFRSSNSAETASEGSQDGAAEAYPSAALLTDTASNESSDVFNDTTAVQLGDGSAAAGCDGAAPLPPQDAEPVAACVTAVTPSNDNEQLANSCPSGNSVDAAQQEHLHHVDDNADINESSSHDRLVADEADTSEALEPQPAAAMPAPVAASVLVPAAEQHAHIAQRPAAAASGAATVLHGAGAVGLVTSSIVETPFHDNELSYDSAAAVNVGDHHDADGGGGGSSNSLSSWQHGTDTTAAEQSATEGELQLMMPGQSVDAAQEPMTGMRHNGAGESSSRSMSCADEQWVHQEVDDQAEPMLTGDAFTAALPWLQRQAQQQHQHSQAAAAAVVSSASQPAPASAAAVATQEASNDSLAISIILAGSGDDGDDELESNRLSLVPARPPAPQPFASRTVGLGTAAANLFRPTPSHYHRQLRPTGDPFHDEILASVSIIETDLTGNEDVGSGSAAAGAGDAATHNGSGAKRAVDGASTNGGGGGGGGHYVYRPCPVIPLGTAPANPYLYTPIPDTCNMSAVNAITGAGDVAGGRAGTGPNLATINADTTTSSNSSSSCTSRPTPRRAGPPAPTVSPRLLTPTASSARQQHVHAARGSASMPRDRLSGVVAGTAAAAAAGMAMVPSTAPASPAIRGGASAARTPGSVTGRRSAVPSSPRPATVVVPASNAGNTLTSASTRATTKPSTSAAVCTASGSRPLGASPVRSPHHRQVFQTPVTAASPVAVAAASGTRGALQAAPSSSPIMRSVVAAGLTVSAAASAPWHASMTSARPAPAANTSSMTTSTARPGSLLRLQVNLPSPASRLGAGARKSAATQ